MPIIFLLVSWFWSSKIWAIFKSNIELYLEIVFLSAFWIGIVIEEFIESCNLFLNTYHYYHAHWVDYLYETW